MLGVSRQHVHGLTQRGILTPIRLVPRGDLRFRIEDVEALIEGASPASARQALE